MRTFYLTLHFHPQNQLFHHLSPKVQTYGGLVYMDFSQEHFEKNGFGVYKKLNIHCLPPGMYLVYSTKVGC